MAARRRRPLDGCGAVDLGGAGRLISSRNASGRACYGPGRQRHGQTATTVHIGTGGEAQGRSTCVRKKGNGKIGAPYPTRGNGGSGEKLGDLLEHVFGLEPPNLG